MIIHTLELSWAPSVNHCYTSRGWGGGRRLTMAARAYRALCAVRVRDAKSRGDLPRAPLLGRLAVTIRVHPPTLAARDLDNLGKATLDACTHAGVWGDDSQIDRLTFIRAEKRKGGALVLEISTVDGAAA